MKKAIIFTLVCLMILVLVACDPTVEEPVDNMKTAEEWGLNVNSPTTYRRPYAPSDPKNPLDQKSEAIQTMVGVEDHTGRLYEYKWSYGRTIIIELSNSESINNLFYDYTLDDFGIRAYTYKDDYTGETYELPGVITGYIMDGEKCVGVEELRAILRNGEIVDLTNIKRTVRIEYSVPIADFKPDDNGEIHPSEEEWMSMLVYISKLDYVTHIDWLKGWFSTTPTGYSANNSWALERINIREAWDYTTGSPNVTVGVMDSGVRTTHDAIEHAYNANFGIGDSYDDDFIPHATLVAGIMFAEDSQNGLYGVCHDAQFVSLKANYGSGLEEVDLVIECLEYAQANSIPIVNFSGGFYAVQMEGCGYIPQDKIDDLYNAVANYSGLLVVAAGNECKNLDTDLNKLYPQCFDLPNIIVVGASNQSDDVWTYLQYGSNYGSEFVDIFAPGKNIRTTSASSDTAIVSGQQGTSMAAPFVAGVAALLKSYDYTLTTAQIKETILNSVTKVDDLSDKCVSGGILNAQAALEYVCKHECETATSTNSTQHTGICNLCGHDVVDEHNFSYTKISVSAGHSCTCVICGYVGTEFHEWQPRYLMGEIRGYECKQCGIFTLNIDISFPGTLKAEFTNMKRGSVLSDEMMIMHISDHVALLYQDGKYSLLIECDERGNPLVEIPKEIFVEGYDMSELEQQLRTAMKAILAYFNEENKICLGCNTLKESGK